MKHESRYGIWRISLNQSNPLKTYRSSMTASSLEWVYSLLSHSLLRSVRIPWLDISLQKWWLVILVLDDDSPMHHYLKGKVFRKATSWKWLDFQIPGYQITWTRNPAKGVATQQHIAFPISPALFCCILNFEATESEECFGCCFPNQGEDHGGNMVGVHPRQRVERVVSRMCCTSLVSDGRKQSHDGSERTWSDESALAFSFPFWPALDHLPLDQDQENHLCFLHYFILKYFFIYLSDFWHIYIYHICIIYMCTYKKHHVIWQTFE